jgi:ribosomal protein S27AE
MRQKSHTRVISMPKIVLIGKVLSLSEGVIYMVMWKLKSCPRCGGDIFIDRDLDGWHEQCLQCSYRRELKKIAEFKEQPVPAGEARPKKEPVS